VFAIAAAAIILINRPHMPWTRRAILIAALLGGAALESAIDLCFTNVLVLLTLILALAGETYYESMQSGWHRWSEALWTMVKTPGRWIWLLLETSKRTRGAAGMPPAINKVARTVWIVLPGLAVTLFFAAILWSGNAIFAQLAAQWTDALRDWILSLNISFWRCGFWAFVAWLSLPLLLPSPAPGKDRIWTKELPRLPELVSTGTARLQAAVTLALLNALFCCVNTIDVIYLWARQARALPAGVGYSAFVHEGVASLIVATVFSAILLAGMFHQSVPVSSWMPLRLLGLLWIAQNLLLLAGVFLRVKLYVDAFDLTVTRVNLIFFLILVAIGFLLLAIHVFRQRTLGWLLYTNVLATFFLFYVVQFLDTERFVAQYNVSLFLNSHETSNLDVGYLQTLGPPAYDSLQKVAPYLSTVEASTVLSYLESRASEASLQLHSTPWKSLQLRQLHFQQKLISEVHP